MVCSDAWQGTARSCGIHDKARESRVGNWAHAHTFCTPRKPTGSRRKTAAAQTARRTAHTALSPTQLPLKLTCPGASQCSCVLVQVWAKTPGLGESPFLECLWSSVDEVRQCRSCSLEACLLFGIWADGRKFGGQGEQTPSPSKEIG